MIIVSDNTRVETHGSSVIQITYMRDWDIGEILVEWKCFIYDSTALQHKTNTTKHNIFDIIVSNTHFLMIDVETTTMYQHIVNHNIPMWFFFFKWWQW